VTKQKKQTEEIKRKGTKEGTGGRQAESELREEESEEEKEKEGQEEKEGSHWTCARRPMQMTEAAGEAATAEKRGVLWACRSSFFVHRPEQGMWATKEAAGLAGPTGAAAATGPTGRGRSSRGRGVRNSAGGKRRRLRLSATTAPLCSGQKITSGT